MAIGEPEAIVDAPLAGRSAAEDGGGESFLPREEWASAQGKKVDPPPLRPGDRGAARWCRICTPFRLNWARQPRL